jgi:hypothetical protein
VCPISHYFKKKQCHFLDSIQKSSFLETENPNHIETQGVITWKGFQTVDHSPESIKIQELSNVWTTLLTIDSSAEVVKKQESSQDFYTLMLNSKWWIVTTGVLVIILSIMAVIYMKKRKQRMSAVQRLSNYQAVQHIADYDRLQRGIALPAGVQWREENSRNHYNVVTEDRYFASELHSSLSSQDELRDLEMIQGQIEQDILGTELSHENEESCIQILPSDDYLEVYPSDALDRRDYIPMTSSTLQEDKVYLSDRNSECSLDLK